MILELGDAVKDTRNTFTGSGTDNVIHFHT